MELPSSLQGCTIANILNTVGAPQISAVVSPSLYDWADAVTMCDLLNTIVMIGTNDQLVGWQKLKDLSCPFSVSEALLSPLTQNTFLPQHCSITLYAK